MAEILKGRWAPADKHQVRRLALLAALVLVTILGSPMVASAASGSAQGAAAGSSAGVALPMVSPQSTSVPPAGFSSNAQAAAHAAESSKTMQSLHRREHPLQIEVFVWAGRSWLIDFFYQRKLTAAVDVSAAGRVTAVWTGPLAYTPYARGHFAPVFDSGWVVVPFCLLFLIPFVDVRRPRRLLHLDALVLLSFMVSYFMFDHTHLETAVWLIYPPLLYLLGRLLAIGMRGAGRQGLSPLLSLRVLGIGLLALVAARIGLSLLSHKVVDVGYASVIGASHIIHGQPLYYAAAAHADTYGPIAYLAYVPFVQLFPWHGSWDYLPSAHAASVFFDLVTIVGLVVIGRRLRPGSEGKRLGLALGWAWAACPFTLLGLIMHTNDGLVAMLSVLALVAFSSPSARGGLLALAAAAKFSPAALLPLFASSRDGGLRRTLICVATFAAVVAVSVGLYLPSGGVKEFYDHTIGYQLNRTDVFSAWALHPGLDAIKSGLEIAAVLLAGAVALVPARRTMVALCALAAAVTIAVQLPAIHWFYYYIIWFLPFALIALITPTTPPPGDTTGQRAGARPPVEDKPAPEPVLAGV